MIESAVAKLTFAYLAILMIMSIGFSLLLYRVSEVALTNSLRQPRQAVFRETSLYNYDDFRTDRLREARLEVRKALLILNVVTFAGGFAVSYALARRTLSPIDRALNAQKRFAADASHELRTPLATMQSEIEVAMRDPKLKLDDAKDLLHSNLEEVQRMRRLADDLLQLARQEQPRSNVRVHTVMPIILDSVDLVEKQADMKQIQINLPTSTAKRKVDADSLRSILKILLDNAIKYSSPGSQVTIAVDVNRRLYIHVIDEGPGIETADLPFVFDRFFRADKARSSAKTEGHGLGLSIAKKLADAHGWKLSVVNNSKRGATFTICIK